MLDSDLAEMYGVETGALKRAVWISGWGRGAFAPEYGQLSPRNHYIINILY